MSLEDNLKGQYIESKRIISDAKRDGQLVLFVGAGASIASGMPTWGEAVKIIAGHLGIRDISSDDYLRIPQYYYNSRDKKEYTQLMQEVFLYRKFLPTTSIHDMIMEFNTQTIITTNYDHLIEQTAEKHSEMIRVISKDNDLPYGKSSRELIKMHGDFENDNFVLKEDDYLTYSENFRLIENYIKSIIGTKVVLFIGYSFSDPDVKHIFSWAKEILHGDFQTAYLINVDDTYNLDVDRYYKNFGINVLFSSVMLGISNENLDKTERLKKMLQWLLEREGYQSKLEELYDKLKIFRYFNYPHGSRIELAFRNLGYRFDSGYLALEFFPEHHTFIKNHEVLSSILYAIVYARYKQKPEDVYVETEGEGKKRFKMGECFKALDEEREYIDSLLDVLNKSSIKGVMVFIPIDDNYHVLDNEKVFNGTHHRVFADLCDVGDIPEWLNYIYKFDDKKLKHYSEMINNKLNESTPDLYMEQASIRSYFGEFLASYNCLKTVASLYYKNGEIVKYYIAETDRYYIGKLIKNRGSFYGISADDMQEVSKEISSINLDSTYWSLPDLGSGKSVLKDISSFDMAYTLFQDAYMMAEKVRDQANTKYNLFAGLPAFSIMKNEIMDYQNFEFRNHIILDRYGDNNLIYKLYFQSILASVLSPDLGTVEKDDTSNVHADRFTWFELFIALKYITYSDLKKLLLDVGRIPVEEDGLKYLQDVIECVDEPHDEWIFTDNFPFWKAILLMGHFDVSKTLFSVTLNKICEIVKNQHYRDYSNLILRFIYNAEPLDLISDENVKHIKKILNDILLYLSKEGKGESQRLTNIVQYLAHICSEHGVPYDDITIISELFVEQTKILCMELYPSLGDSARRWIRERYMSGVTNDNPNEYILYCIAAGNDVIEINGNVEKIIIEYVLSEKNRFDKSKEDHDRTIISPVRIGMQEPHYIQLIGLLCDMYLRNHIANTELLIETVRKVGDSFSVWLIDLDSFDYSKFDIEWLNRCYPPLLKDIRNNDKARVGIANRIAELYLKGKVDKQLLERYFKYIVSPDS